MSQLRRAHALTEREGGGGIVTSDSMPLKGRGKEKRAGRGEEGEL